MAFCQILITAEITKNRNASFVELYCFAPQSTKKQFGNYWFYLHAYFEHHRVLSRNCTYQSHALLSKGGSLQPSTSQQWENRGPDFHNSVQCLGFRNAHTDTTRKASLKWAHGKHISCHRFNKKVKQCSAEKERKLGDGRTIGGSAGYPTRHLYSHLKKKHSYN